MKFILSVSKFARQSQFKLFEGFIPCLLVRLTVPMEFLNKFISGLGRMIFSFLLRPEFHFKNKSLHSITV